MSWPTQQEYNEAIQGPSICFEDAELRSGKVECDRLGLPRPRSGNFATVYKLQATGRTWAIRCFNRQMHDEQERYAAINAHLHKVALPYMVDFSFLQRGIRIKGGWYPLVKMEWAHGEPLNLWVERNLHNPSALVAFSQSFITMLSALQKASIAHGDLQHGNILVVNSIPRLVDYDGMYVPALSGRISNEVGQPNYQHPRRTALDFGPYLDNFSGWVIWLSIFALTINPKLWQTFRGGDDCLLFKKRDFEEPHRSALLKALESESNPQFRQAIDMFRTVLGCPMQGVPAVDGTLYIPVVSSAPTLNSGASWIQDHISSTPARVGGAPDGKSAIDWLVDATHEVGPPVHFEEQVGVTRALAYLTIALIAAAAYIALHVGAPLLLLGIPLAFGANLLLWRTGYQRERPVSQRAAILTRRVELQERIRVMQQQIADIEAEKQRANQQVSVRKAASVKTQKDLLQAEQKAHGLNDARLQSSISAAIQGKQKLDAQELKELSALQNTLGKSLASLAQSLGSLAQTEANELSAILKSKQSSFVQTKLQSAWIAHAQLPGIGAGYKSRLTAARIFTAADVDYRIHGVKGIGSQRAAVLQGWRLGVENDAKSRMPKALSGQEENSIRSKYANQKSSLELQINAQQRDLRDQETSIRTKFSTLRIPYEAAIEAERQKHLVERQKIVDRFNQQQDTLGKNLRGVEEDAARAVEKLDVKQGGVRKEMLGLQFRMLKAERDLDRFRGITFRFYAKRVLFS
jgi:hypothetical protein